MNKQIINEAWNFKKDFNQLGNKIDDSWTMVDLPHTWNGEDGQDGGNDYFRGESVYSKRIKVDQFNIKKFTYIEFEGVNSSAKVYINGNLVSNHDGGYSTWRVNVSDYTSKDFTIEVVVDNSPNTRVYPQVADFTFYGGIYRNVSLISVDDLHFDLDYYGGPGIRITPEVNDNDADVEIEVFLNSRLESSEGKIRYSILDGEKEIFSTNSDLGETVVKHKIQNVRLWNGLKDPHLYSAKVELIKDEEVVDVRVVNFGCRYYSVDPENGFFLNGEKYPLRGVAQHQDYPGIGNALTKTEFDQDMELIREIGATTIRLAHYQHNQYYYDLCDKYGLVIWAEIPYISRHMNTAFDNTVSQMKELITQNYNHPSIAVWGISNEITMNGEDDPELLKNHYELNKLCHDMDSTRLTVVAALSSTNPHSEFIDIPDLVSYNHYFGWYAGDVLEGGPWFDKFHKERPDVPVGLSEYGCEGLHWHTSEPEAGDYSEEYQAYVHEEMIKQLFARDFIWATHVWNMFDFAADARNEGGEDGMNHKGLVSFDRKYKKDAFYAHKAWMSKEPFVHLCSKKYIDRVEAKTFVNVYSNQPEVELYINNEFIEKKQASDHFFKFEINNIGESKIEVRSGTLIDTGVVRKVEEANPDYSLPNVGPIINWFEVEMPAGYFSINDKVGNIIKVPEGRDYIINYVRKFLEGHTANSTDDELLNFISSYTVQGFIAFLAPSLNIDYTKEEVLELNEGLNKIKKK